METQLMSNIEGLPTASNVEADLLGSILINNDNYHTTKSLLTPQFFSLPQHSELYKIMSHLMSTKKTISESLLIEYIKSNNLVDCVGGISFLLTIQERLLSPESVIESAKKIRELYLRRKIMSMYVTGIDLCKSAQDDFAQASINYIDSILKVISIGNDYDCERIIEALDRVMINLFSSNGLSVISSGINSLDRLINGGFVPGNLVLVASRPSLGKTSLGMDFVYNMSQNNKSSMVITLEMSVDEIVLRGISRFTGIAQCDIRDKKFDQYPSMLELIKQARQDVFRVMPLYLSGGLNSIEHIISLIEARHRNKPLDVVFIDYLQLIESRTGRDNRTAQLTFITRQFKLLAQKLGIVVILASQLNREVEKRDGGQPRLSDLRESGSIEQDADVVIFIHVEDPDNKNIKNVTIAKQRNGERDIYTKLLFDGVRTSFRDLKESNDSAQANYYEPQGDDI